MSDRPTTDDRDVDVGRRRFFGRFATEVVSAAAAVVNAAQQLQQDSIETARGILAGEEAPPRPAAPVTAASVAATTDPVASTEGSGVAVAASDPAPAGFRTPFRWDDDVLRVVDQRRLPNELVEVDVHSAAEGAWAIRQMIVRGAPAIGQVAAISLALTAAETETNKPHARRAMLRGAASALRNSRPTAVNLGWALDRMMARYDAIGGVGAEPAAISAALRDEAEAMVYEATADHGRLAEFGLQVLPDTPGRPLRILTHCNTGPLACGQFGTALGVVQAAHNAERPLEVFVDETRPYLQGARLTAWELEQAGVPHTLIPDVAAGHLMARGEVDVILVGADRIAANGDTANKVGTYTLAVLAERHGVPFYVCAPTSSIDLATPDGEAIPIEERPADEVLLIKGVAIAPRGTPVRNPAFDVTPADLVTAIVTEEGVALPPYEPSLAEAVRSAAERRTREGRYWVPQPPEAADPADSADAADEVAV